MHFQDTEVTQILVDYPHQQISVNNGEIVLRPRTANGNKIMLMAYLAAHATKYPPVSPEIKGFTWNWGIENIQKYLGRWGISTGGSFRQLWYQGCLEKRVWSIEDDEAKGLWLKEGGELLQEIFLSDKLESDERLLIDAPRNVHRIHLPDAVDISIVPDHEDLVECIKFLEEGDEHQVNGTEESSTTLSKTGPSKPDYSRLLNVPSPPGIFLGRASDLRFLKRRLGVIKVDGDSADSHQITVIRGLAGMGKSTILSVLANESDVIEHFRDGIIWTSLGQEPSIRSELANWANMLGNELLSVAGDVPRISRELTKMLRGKKMLLIVDDIWDSAHAVAFQVGGSECRMLVSTREPATAWQLATAEEDIYPLAKIDELASLEVLKRHAPDVVNDYPKECSELVKALDGLPLALRVAGRLLSVEAGHQWGASQLLNELKDDASLLMNSKAPSDMVDLMNETTPTVAALFKKSTSRLDEHTRGCFALLGVFAPKPATFDVGAMAHMWEAEDAKPTIRELVARGLLEPAKDGRYQMHALLVTHAKSMLTK
ncbi:NB-ARC domain-containing protein [Planctomycetota bacterium]